jgi:16S rRNA (uracil1498-N3)-methyltransferase
MADRYYSAHPVSGDRITLAGPEAHHLAHVARARPGDEVLVFDGLGGEFAARVERVGRGEVELAIVGRREVDREIPLELSVAAALPKGDRQRWLVEKAVELGVTRLVPLVTTRGVAQPVEKAIDRLRRTVIEASKQCGRTRLLEIAEPERWDEFCARPASSRCHRAVAHPAGGEPARSLFELLAPPRRIDSLVLAVGPEGGFTAEELAQATAAGWSLLSLGPRVLRVETAVGYLAALVAAASE